MQTPRNSETGGLQLSLGYWIAFRAASILCQRRPSIANYVIAAAAISTIPLLLMLPGIYSVDSPVSQANRVAFALWPWLLSFLPLLFARKAAMLLADSQQMLLKVSRPSELQEVHRQWRRHCSFAKQGLVGLLIGFAGAVASLLIVRSIGVPLPSAALGASCIFVAGFFGGLGFVMGAWSPKLARSVALMDLNLEPLTPNRTMELRGVAKTYSFIVLYGSVVGVLLSTPLAYLASQYSALSLRALFMLAIIPAWITVIYVMVAAHRSLARQIQAQKTRTCSHIEKLVRNEFVLMLRGSGSSAETLKELHGLLDIVRGSGRLAIDVRGVVQSALSLLVVLIPILVERFLAERP